MTNEGADIFVEYQKPKNQPYWYTVRSDWFDRCRYRSQKNLTCSISALLHENIGSNSDRNTDVYVPHVPIDFLQVRCLCRIFSADFNAACLFREPELTITGYNLLRNRSSHLNRGVRRCMNRWLSCSAYISTSKITIFQTNFMRKVIHICTMRHKFV